MLHHPFTGTESAEQAGAGSRASQPLAAASRSALPSKPQLPACPWRSEGIHATCIATKQGTKMAWSLGVPTCTLPRLQACLPAARTCLACATRGSATPQCRMKQASRTVSGVHPNNKPMLSTSIRSTAHSVRRSIGSQHSLAELLVTWGQTDLPRLTPVRGAGTGAASHPTTPTHMHISITTARQALGSPHNRIQNLSNCLTTRLPLLGRATAAHPTREPGLSPLRTRDAGGPTTPRPGLHGRACVVATIPALASAMTSPLLPRPSHGRRAARHQTTMGIGGGGNGRARSPSVRRPAPQRRQCQHLLPGAASLTRSRRRPRPARRRRPGA